MKSNYLNQLPKARTAQLIIKELPDETLVYDLTADKAHCLNRTAALVWKKCDGNTSTDGIAKAIASEEQCEIDQRLVWLALHELKKFNLIEGASLPAEPAYLTGMSRRQLVRNIGFAALALPAIISIAAPSAQAQGSCVGGGTRAPGASCGSGNQCCSGVCCTATSNPGCLNNTCL